MVAAFVAPLIAASGAAVWVPAARATFAGRNGDLLLLLNALRGDPPQLWLSGPLGQDPRGILPDPRCGLDGAMLTRSGSQIVFQQMVGCFSDTGFDRFQVGLVNFDGSGARVLARFAAPVDAEPSAELPGDITQSPNGRTLAYGFLFFKGPGRGVEYRVIFIDMKTGRRTHPIAFPESWSNVTWSSNGRLYFLASTLSGDGAIAAARPDGSHRQLLKIDFPGQSAGQIIVQELSPSPDGSRLAVTGVTQTGSCGGPEAPECPSDLYVVNAHGGKARRLTYSRQAGALVWSPDGREIAYHDGLSNKILDVSTRQSRRLVERIPSGGLGVIDWQALP